MSKLIHNANDTRKRIRENDNDDDKVVKKTSNKTKKANTDTENDTSAKTKTKTNSKKVTKSSNNDSTNDKDTTTITTTTTNTKSTKSKAKATTKNITNNNTKTPKSKSLLKSDEESNIIYLGHVPNGFDEKAMKQYFKQFGDVKKVKLFRSMKTNRSKGYAFVQFIDHDVAAIVAEAMDGYMMYEKQLVCHVVPKEKCHTGMFKKPKPKQKVTNEGEADDEDEDGNE